MTRRKAVKAVQAAWRAWLQFSYRYPLDASNINPITWINLWLENEEEFCRLWNYGGSVLVVRTELYSKLLELKHSNGPIGLHVTGPGQTISDVDIDMNGKGVGVLDTSQCSRLSRIKISNADVGIKKVGVSDT